jgi:thiol:disulfide interchange protein
MSPLSVHFDGSEESQGTIGKWQYLLAFLSLIPFIGILPACASTFWGVVKIDKKGGAVLLVLGLAGFGITGAVFTQWQNQIFALFSNSTPTVTASAPVEGSGTISWLQPSDGLALSEKTGKPILYDFKAHWCGYCKLMDEKVFEKTEYAAKINSLYIPVVVMDTQKEKGSNTPDVAQLQGKYRVGAYPTLVVQYPRNGPSRVMLGFEGEDKVMAFLTQESH